jgi:hypothetical protein
MKASKIWIIYGKIAFTLDLLSPFSNNYNVTWKFLYSAHFISRFIYYKSRINCRQKYLEACFSTLIFRISSGLPLMGSPNWCRIWSADANIYVMKWYWNLALSLEVYGRKGNHFIIGYKLNIYILQQTMLYWVNQWPYSLWFLTIKRQHGYK